MTLSGPETQVLDPPPALAESVDLLSRGRAGDGTALAELAARYQDRVRRIVSIRLGAEFRGLVESLDIPQDTWMAALRDHPGLQPRDHGGFIRWLARISETQVLDASDRLRAARRDGRSEHSAGTAAASGAANVSPPAPGPPPGESAGRQGLRAAYDACVAELDTVHRDVILLRDYALLDWPGVCEELGRPSVPATQELHRRALVALAGKLRRRLGG